MVSNFLYDTSYNSLQYYNIDRLIERYYNILNLTLIENYLICQMINYD